MPKQSKELREEYREFFGVDAKDIWVELFGEDNEDVRKELAILTKQVDTREDRIV